MDSPRDPHRRLADGTRHPRTAVAQGYSRHTQQPQHPASVPQGISQYQRGLYQTQQVQANGQRYQMPETQHTYTYEDTQGYAYAPSTLSAYQGSSGSQQYDYSIGGQDRVTLPGDQYSCHDPRERTAKFVGSRQHMGARYAPYAEGAEQHGVIDAVETITNFDNSFSRDTTQNATIAQDNQQGGISWPPYPQRIDPSYREYHPTTEYPNPRSNSSRTWR